MIENINWEVLLQYTNILIILYAIIYATRFIYLTRDDNARKPWEYLTYAIIILFLLQILNFLNIEINIIIQQVLTMILATLLLIVFIYQNYHMKKSNFETLTRKEMIPVDER